MSDIFESLRVITRLEAWTAIGVSRRTWQRMEARGETPPITRLSRHRVGYRITDLKAWLDARRGPNNLPQTCPNPDQGKI